MYDPIMQLLYRQINLWHLRSRPWRGGRAVHTRPIDSGGLHNGVVSFSVQQISKMHPDGVLTWMTAGLLECVALTQGDTHGQKPKKVAP